MSKLLKISWAAPFSVLLIVTGCSNTPPTLVASRALIDHTQRTDLQIVTDNVSSNLEVASVGQPIAINNDTYVVSKKYSSASGLNCLMLDASTPTASSPQLSVCREPWGLKWFKTKDVVASMGSGNTSVDSDANLSGFSSSSLK
ncbi:hypothetical protein [Pokkaliibacter plantistimulans]|uniref:hypothetical protein n=1 Tax=Pokkaliibacter plantistimulans TaxID=1635171 RepID=UPI001057D0DF|nr:hypothetical protein [Pokkaliibacter plantistimulans]